MFRTKKPAPAVFLAMTPAELAAYNKQQTKKYVALLSAAVIVPVAAAAAAEFAAKVIDKKLEAHYIAKNN